MNGPENTDQIQTGDRFYKIGHWESIWVVRRVFVPEGETVTHVVIERIESPGDFIVVAQETMLNVEDYRPDRRNPDAVNVTEHRRRRTDPPTAEPE